MKVQNIKEWTRVFKALSNPNRLKILALLYPRGRLSVNTIASRLGISPKNTSRNLLILSGAGILESEGKSGRVFYFTNPSLNKNVRGIIEIFLSSTPL